jgi:AraC-like DNA-binding protein
MKSELPNLVGTKPGALDLSEPEGRVLKMIEMIEAEPLCRISDLARVFNLSHSHLKHLFKKQTGVPLGHLLAQRRLHCAASLLSDTNMRIKRIAQTVGYEHTSSFVRAFERQFAKAPRAYRLESIKHPVQIILQTAQLGAVPLPPISHPSDA